MIQFNYNKKKKKALSLAEVLIVLGVISSALVVAVSFLVESIITLRVNETEDTVNFLMLTGVELARTSSELNISDDQGFFNGGSTNYFYINDADPSDATDFELVIDPIGSEITTCGAAQSNYYVSNFYIENLANLDNFCMQIIFEPSETAGDLTAYPVRVKTIYQVSGEEEFRIKNIRGYKYGAIQ